METIFQLSVALVFGYLFGKLTCSQHIGKHGFALTLGVFTALNILHASVDGMLLNTQEEMFFVALHEVIRQPALYILAFAIVAPWRKKYSKLSLFVVCFVLVTGTWILGMYLGNRADAHMLIEIHHESLTHAMYGFFAGDIIHHVIDYYMHKK